MKTEQDALLESLVGHLTQEERTAVAELLEKYSEDFILSEMWESRLPYDDVVKSLVEEELVSDFLTLVYGEYDPVLEDMHGYPVGIGHEVLAEGDVGTVVGIDIEEGTLDIEASTGEEKSVKASEVEVMEIVDDD